MRSWVATVIVVLGATACSSTSGTPSDANPAMDSGNGAADARPDLATAMKCTDINLSCYLPTPPSGVPICYEFSNADDAKVAEEQSFCDGAQGTLAHGGCPTGYSGGCVHHEMTPCENVWYWFPIDLLTQVCGSDLILP
jgi:hypothetical protein